MRDEKSSSGAWSYTNKRVPNPPCYGSDIIGEYTGGISELSKSGRSDLIQGNHVSATGYNAYRKSVTLNGDMDIKKNTWQSKYCDGERYYYQQHLSGSRNPPKKWVLLSSSAPNHLPIVSGNTVTRARNNCLSNLSSSKVNLGQSFGEAVANAGLMTEQAILLGKSLYQALNGRPGKAAKAIGLKPGGLDTTAADLFLAYKFGIKPIVNDIYNLHQALLDAFNRDDTEVYSVVGVATTNHGAYWSGQLHVAGKMEEGCQVGVSYKISNSTLAGLNSMGLINPFALAWELLPLSFLVDWFISVGSFLQGLSAPLGLTFRAGYETKFVNTKATVTDYSLLLRYYGTFPSCTINESGMHRVPLSDFPVMGVSYNANLTGGQALVIGALMAQLQ